MGMTLKEIPEKPFYNVREVCELTDTQRYVLTHWENQFPQLSPKKGRGGQAVYRREDLALILRIKELLYEQDYTIKGAREVLESDAEERAATQPQAAAAEPAPTDAPEKATRATRGDTVPRSRYNDAVEEIGELKLRVQELEAELALLRDGQAEEHRRLQEELARKQRVTSILERLLHQVEGRD